MDEVQKIIGKQLSELRPSRYFFRFLAVGLLIIVFLSLVPWTEMIFKPVLRFPNLRHRITTGSSDSLRFLVWNSGYAPARSVLVHISVQAGSITDYQVDSQELYEVKKAELEEGVFDIWLERLTSGARINIEITGTGLVTSTASLSAASERGTSISAEATDIFDQAHFYAPKLARLFKEAGISIWTASKVRRIRSWLSSTSVYTTITQVIRRQEFQTVGLAALIVSCFVTIFSPMSATPFISLVIGFLVWLFFDLHVPARWLIVLVALLACSFIANLSGDWKWKGLGLLLVLGIGCLAIWWFWYASFPITWLLSLIIIYTPVIVATEATADKGGSKKVIE